MLMLFKKLRRDIWETKGQFLSIVIIIAIGAFFFAGMLTATNAINGMINDYYEDQNFADHFGKYYLADFRQVENQLNLNDGDIVEGRFSETISFDTKNITKADGTLNTKSSRTNLKIQTTTEKINIPRIVDKTEFTDAEIEEKENQNIYLAYVDIKYAEAYSLSKGDVLNLDFTITKTMIDAIGPSLSSFITSDILLSTKLEIAGTFDSPEYVFKASETGLPTAQSSYGVITVERSSLVGFMTKAINKEYSTLPPENLESAIDFLNNVVTDVFVITENETSVESIFGTSQTPSSPQIGDFLYAYSRENHVSYANFNSTIEQISNLVAIFPFIFFIVASIITFISMSKTVENQRTQIGIMQAIGIKKSNIYMSFLMYGIVASLIGSLIGGIVGVFFLPEIYKLVFELQYTLPSYSLSHNPIYLSLAIPVSLVFSVLAVYISCRKTLNEIPAQALRQKPPKKTKPILLEKWKWFWNKIGFKSKIVFRNIFLHKTRIFLSSIGVIGCIVLLITGLGIKDRVDYVLDSYTHTMNYDIQVIFANPNATENDFKETHSNIKEIGLGLTTNATYFNKEKSESLSIVAVPNGSTFTRVKEQGKFGNDIPIDSNSVLISHSFADDYSIAIGDTISVTSMNAQNEAKTVKLKVTGFCEQFVTNNIYLSTDNLLPGRVLEGFACNTAYARVENASLINETREALLDNPLLFTATAISRADLLEIVDSMLLILNTFISIIILGAAGLAIAVIYNITAINLFERRRELATLKVLGCHKREINILIIIENIVTTIIGCLIGFPLGYAMFKYTVSIALTFNFPIPNNLTVSAVLISFAVTFLFSLLATFLLGRKIQKIDMIESLKSNE